MSSSISIHRTWDAEMARVFSRVRQGQSVHRPSARSGTCRETVPGEAEAQAARVTRLQAFYGSPAQRAEALAAVRADIEEGYPPLAAAQRASIRPADTAALCREARRLRASGVGVLRCGRSTR